MELCVMDLCYDRDAAGVTFMRLVGRDRANVKHRVKVTDLVFYVYLAIDYETSYADVQRIGMTLEKRLPTVIACRRSKCSCKPKGEDVFKVPKSAYENMCSLPCTGTYSSVGAYLGADVVDSMGLCGFESENRPFARFSLAQFELVSEAARILKYAYKNRTLPEHLRGIYGEDMNPIYGFYDRLETSSYMWMRLPGPECRLDEVQVLREDTSRVKLVTVSFDIEALPKLGRRFTDPVLDIHPIIAISADTDAGRVVFAYRESSKCKETEVRLFAGEKEMLEGFFAFVRSLDPDIMYGYNINKYDIPYIEIRANKHGITERWVQGETLRYTFNETVTNQLGTIAVSTVHVLGCIFYDLFYMILKTEKLSKNGLADACKAILGEKVKKDLPHDKINEYFNGTPDQVSELYDYNALDSVACTRLALAKMYGLRLQKSCIVIVLDARSVLERGISYHGACYIGRLVKGRYLFPSKKGRDVVPSFKHVQGFERMIQDMMDDNSYEGAFVLEPHTGLCPHPMSIFDVGSLYPSAIIAGNLCWTTLLPETREYKREWPIDMKKDVYVGSTGHVFTREKLGVLPEACLKLKAYRKTLKDKLKQPGLSKEEKNALDAEQGAVKVLNNSLYGMNGGATGVLSCPPVAACTTGLGREVLMTGVNFISNMHIPGFGVEGCEGLIQKVYPPAAALLTSGARVMYGDTDSLMIAYENLTYEQSLEVGPVLEHVINNCLGMPYSVVWERESDCVIACFVVKKRYFYVKWSKKDGLKVTYKGLEIVRRDFFPYLTSVMQGVFDSVLRVSYNHETGLPSADILHPEKKQGILMYVMHMTQRMIGELLDGRVSNDDLLMTCNISKNLDEYTTASLPQVTIAKQLMQAKIPVDPGTRVSYYYHGNNEKKYQNVVASELVDEEFKPNYMLYFDKMLKPLQNVLQLIIGQECADYVLNPDRYAKTSVDMTRYFGARVPTPAIEPIKYAMRMEEVQDPRIDGTVHKLQVKKTRRRVKQDVKSGDITDFFKSLSQKPS